MWSLQKYTDSEYLHYPLKYRARARTILVSMFTDILQPGELYYIKSSTEKEKRFKGAVCTTARLLRLSERTPGEQDITSDQQPGLGEAALMAVLATTFCI